LVISARWLMNHIRSGMPRTETPPTPNIHKTRALLVFPHVDVTVLSDAMSWCKILLMAIILSGGSPRQGVNTWIRMAKRAVSVIKAENRSWADDAQIGGRLKRCKRSVHILVRITPEVSALGYE
jgi:hypothetical protein